jgi:hypothetical protein
MTMNTTKTLMLAALATLSIGSGIAMAQEADYQNLWNGGMAPKTLQSTNTFDPATLRQPSIVTMFGSQHRTTLEAQPGFSGADGSAGR